MPPVAVFLADLGSSSGVVGFALVLLAAVVASGVLDTAVAFAVEDVAAVVDDAPALFFLVSSFLEPFFEVAGASSASSDSESRTVRFFVDLCEVDAVDFFSLATSASTTGDFFCVFSFFTTCDSALFFFGGESSPVDLLDFALSVGGFFDAAAADELAELLAALLGLLLLSQFFIRLPDISLRFGPMFSFDVSLTGEETTLFVLTDL